MNKGSMNQPIFVDSNSWQSWECATYFIISVFVFLTQIYHTYVKDTTPGHSWTICIMISAMNIISKNAKG